jgi:ankyrin repeat protein
MVSSHWRWIVPAGIAWLNAYGAEPAVIEIVRSGNLAQLQDLIARKEGLQARGAQNQTGLHEAAARCNLQAARMLVDAGLDRSALDNAGRTAGELAFTCRDAARNKELVRLLWVPRPPAAAKADANARWTLHGAAARGDANVVEMLLKLGVDVNGVNGNGDRALEVACRKGDARTVEILLKRAADVRLTSSSGTTVLHEAALGGDPRVIELLIRHGAEVDAPDREKAATPLQYAASFGRPEAVRMLVQHGADVRRKDRNGRDAFAAATANGHSEVAEMLRTRYEPVSNRAK